jgi:primosomal protein N' (replication factor Y)
VRIPLQGRRVRGWVVEDRVTPETTAVLRPVLAAVSEGPPPDVVALTEWVAWRWCGPRVAVLRTASPPNNVPIFQPASVEHAQRAQLTPVGRVARVPPLHDRRTDVEALLAATGSSIVCVADGARAGSLARWLTQRGRSVARFHSDEPAAARTAAWRTAARGSCVVVGGRIAAFAPVPDLAAVILVDDADEALQEERVPTWHARDVLLERATRAGATWSVLSPAPTVEAAAAVDFAVTAPPEDVERAGWPRVIVVDRREQPPGAKLLTEQLADALRSTDGLAVCVLNRRGRFRLLACDRCHELIRWDRTDERPALCPACGGTKLRVIRAGVTRVREELAALVPGREVVDIDAGSGDDAAGTAGIVVGTEAVFHRADVRRRRPALVALLDFDQELMAPRYRAASLALWLAVRGAQLLAARPRPETLLLIQTRVPDHDVVRAIRDARPQLVLDTEAALRRATGAPPFGALAELSGEDAPLRAAVDALGVLGVRVLGPNDGRVLVQAADDATLAAALHDALPTARAAGRIRVAVDPPRV